MEKNRNQTTDQNYTKISTLMFLRNQDKAYRHKMKKQGRMIRRRKYLKQHIYDNNNIFQMSTGKFNRKAAQNIIWQKNYKLKMAINILRQENNSIKAKLWNIQKENRKMDRQIQAWNLEKLFNCSNNKPYIDMATVSKVFADQDYEIVSTKIDIAKYERILQEKQDEIQRLTTKAKEVQKHEGHLRHIASIQTCQFLASLQNEIIEYQGQQQYQKYIQAIKNNLNSQVASKNQRVEYLKKNIEIKKKVNAQHENEKQNVCKQVVYFKDVKQQQIQKLKQQTRRIKIQQQNSIKDFKKQLKNLKKSTINYECEIQQDMGEFIKKKIQVQSQIEQILKKIQDQLGESPCYRKQILPAIQAIEAGNYNLAIN